MNNNKFFRMIDKINFVALFHCLKITISDKENIINFTSHN